MSPGLLTAPQRRVLELLAIGDMDAAALQVNAVRLDVLQALAKPGLCLFLADATPPVWTITAAGRELLSAGSAP